MRPITGRMTKSYEFYVKKFRWHACRGFEILKILNSCMENSRIGCPQATNLRYIVLLLYFQLYMLLYNIHQFAQFFGLCFFFSFYTSPGSKFWEPQKATLVSNFKFIVTIILKKIERAINQPVFVSAMDTYGGFFFWFFVFILNTYGSCLALMDNTLDLSNC